MSKFKYEITTNTPECMLIPCTPGITLIRHDPRDSALRVENFSMGYFTVGHFSFETFRRKDISP